MLPCDVGFCDLPNCQFCVTWAQLRSDYYLNILAYFLMSPWTSKNTLITSVILKMVSCICLIKLGNTYPAAQLLYKASILSFFDIGDIFYHSANKAPLAKLQSLQNKALRCIYLNDKQSSTIELHIKVKYLH